MSKFYLIKCPGQAKKTENRFKYTANIYDQITMELQPFIVLRTTMNGQSSIVIWSYIFAVCWCEFEQGISYFVNLNPIFNRQGFFLSLWQYRIYSPLIKKVARDCVSGGLHACVIYFCPCGHLCICFSSSVELSSTTSQGKY